MPLFAHIFANQNIFEAIWSMCDSIFGAKATSANYSLGPSPSSQPPLGTTVLDFGSAGIYFFDFKVLHGKPRKKRPPRVLQPSAWSDWVKSLFLFSLRLLLKWEVAWKRTWKTGTEVLICWSSYKAWFWGRSFGANVSQSGTLRGPLRRAPPISKQILHIEWDAIGSN